MKLLTITELQVEIMDREKNKINKIYHEVEKNWISSPKWIRFLIKCLAWVGSVFIVGIIVPALFSNYFQLPNDISYLSDDIENLSTDLSKQISEVKDMISDEEESREGLAKDLGEDIDNVNERIDKLYLRLDVVPYLRPTSTFSEKITKEYNEIDSLNRQDVGLEATSLVAFDYRTNTEYSVEQLSEQRLLLPYTNEGQEIVFYGQFNEKGQWDGACTLNVYKDDKLVLITDAEYDDGNLVKSKQVFSYELASGKKVWAFSDRTYIGNDESSGDTWLYEWTKDYVKDFDLDDVTVSDVIYPSIFKNLVGCFHLEAYYSGNTSNGYFNDDSGNAFMIYFQDDGTVRLLYTGKFKNGTFNDDTGEAWYIVKEEDTDYMYYKGNFKNGEEDHSGVTELGAPPLTLDQIQAYLGDRQYGVELRWSGFDTPKSQDSMI